MGGDSVRRTARAIATPVTAPFEAAARIVTGENVGSAVGKSIKPAVQGVGSILSGFNSALFGQEESVSLPDAGSGVSPEERARLLREQEINILRDRPGRAGTILTR